jgi:hypothetical protein
MIKMFINDLEYLIDEENKKGWAKIKFLITSTKHEEVLRQYGDILNKYKITVEKTPNLYSNPYNDKEEIINVYIEINSLEEQIQLIKELKQEIIICTESRNEPLIEIYDHYRE